MSQPASAPRFFCSPLPHPRLSDRTCALDPEQSRHARKVLRLEAGQPIRLFDGKGHVAEGVLLGYEGKAALCEVITLDDVAPPRPHLTVATAVPKGSYADDMVVQLSQLGCDRLVPLVTARSVVEPRASKLDRFEKAAVESAKQSGRPYLMSVDAEVSPLEAALEIEAEVKLIATIGDFGLPDLATRLRRAERVVVLIGPEGDWTAQEVEAARAAGFHSWTLGPNVLRVGTAALAATAVLRYLAEQK